MQQNSSERSRFGETDLDPQIGQVLAWFEHHIRIGTERGNIAPDTDPASTAVVLLGARPT